MAGGNRIKNSFVFAISANKKDGNPGFRLLKKILSLIDQMCQQSVSQLWLKPGAFGGHHFTTICHGK